MVQPIKFFDAGASFSGVVTKSFTTGRLIGLGISSQQVVFPFIEAGEWFVDHGWV
jgi:hypothetical protein